MKKLLNFYKNNFDKLLITFSILLVLGLTIPTLFSNNHFLYNLEPYPDGLFYTLSAKNLIENGSLSLEYNGIGTPISQPPLYSLILSTGYLLWNNPASFYLMNIMLLLGSFLLVIKLITDSNITNFQKAITTLFFITHSYLYLLVSLPMTENLTLFLFILGTYFIIKKNFTEKDLFITFIIGIGLTLTRLSIVPVAITLILIGLFRVNKIIDKKRRTIYILFSIFLMILANYSFIALLDKSIFEYFIYFIKESFFSTQENSFYNSAYISNNLVSYSKVILGFKSNFLWFAYPLTSIGLLLATTINLIQLSKKRFVNLTPIFILITSIFSLLITFYVNDARYIIYIIPSLIVILSKSYPKNISTKYSVFLVFLLIIHISTQLLGFRQLVADNIFHKSTAWQYEASKIIGNFASENIDAKIITALPPHLVDAYSTNNIRVYPMSNSQEFLQKKQYLWGSDIEYGNLLEFYKTEIKNGSEIFISNAYITHQQSVINDYEKLKEEFNFKLEKSGCLNACNIYKLELKN